MRYFTSTVMKTSLDFRFNTRHELEIFCMLLMFSFLRGYYATNFPNYLQNITCEGDEKKVTIECSTTRLIYIKSGFYGRKNNYTCEHRNMDHTNCSGGENKIKNKCHCKSKCIIEANNKFFSKWWLSLFGDPCRGTYKYINITWICVSSTENDCRSFTSTQLSKLSTISAQSNQPSTMQSTTTDGSAQNSNYQPSMSSILSTKESTAFLDAVLLASATTNPSMENRSVIANSLLTSSWVGILLGIIATLMIIAASVLAYFKRKFLFKSLNKNKPTKKINESNIHLPVEKKTFSRTKDDRLSTDGRHPESSLETGTEMTINALYKSFDPVTNGNTAQINSETNDLVVESKPSKMTKNILYDSYHT